MKRAVKIKEWIKFTIYAIAFVIFEIAVILGIVTSSDGKMPLYILLFVIQFIILISSIIKHLINLIKGHQEQKSKRAKIADTVETVGDIIDTINSLWP